jgi:hypothetical protein
LACGYDDLPVACIDFAAAHGVDGKQGCSSDQEMHQRLAQPLVQSVAQRHGRP